MRILKIILKGFKRFPLRDSDTFEHTFKSKFTIITGINGAGKSSLANELTPLPSDKSDFGPNGYKEIHIEKDNQLFKLICDFSSGSKFSFLLGEEELNVAHNVSTQKELVYKYFGITPSIHEILTGSDTFTEMSLINRKKFFNAITHLNIDDILDQYNKYKEEHSNQTFMMKSLVSLIQAEQAKLSNPDRIIMLKETQKDATELIEIAYRLQTELSKYLTEDTNIESKIQSFKVSRQKLKDFIKRNYIYLTAYSADIINQYKTELTEVKTNIDFIYRQIEEYQDKIRLIKMNSNLTIEDVKTKIQEMLIYKNRLISQFVFIEPNLDKLNIYKQDAYKLEVSLPETVHTIPLNPDKKFSLEKYEYWTQEKGRLLEELNKLIMEYAEIATEISHLKDHQDDVTCPKCQHTWSASNKEKKLVDLLQKEQLNLKNQIEYKNRITQIDDKITEIKDYFVIYKVYSQLRNSTKETFPLFWDKLDKELLIFNNPSNISSHLTNLLNEIVYLETLKDTNKELEHYQNKIKELSSIQNTNLEDYEIQISQKEDVLNFLNECKDELEHYISYGKISEKIKGLCDTLTEALKHSTEALYDANRGYTIQEMINTINTELSVNKVLLIETQQELSKHNNIQSTIDKYNLQLGEVKEKIEMLDILLNELSPKNGLIAKSISSYINLVINHINKIITNVWKYKMEIRPINIEDDALNYKFKVDVENKVSIEDVSKISSGMKKVINFSFMMFLYKFLKLENYPLWLDEFTTNLDQTHAQEFATLINNMAMYDKFSQMFIISHLNNDYYFREQDIETIEL